MAKRQNIHSAEASGKRRGLCYSRVSSALQASEGESLAVQRQQLEALCTLNSLDLHAVYQEEGVSGARPFTQRPEGARLWDDARPGDVIICMKLDRLSRSPRDALALLDACRERGVGLVIGDMGSGDATHGATAAMLVGILSSVAGFERSRNAERVSEVKASLKAQGRFGGGACPFAYRIVERDGERFIEPDMTLQARVLDLHRRNFSSRMIVVELAKDGIPSSFPTICKFLRENARDAA